MLPHALHAKPRRAHTFEPHASRHSPPFDTAQVSLRPCRLMAPGDADISPALVQLSQLTSLQLGMYYAGDHFSATRGGGGWRVHCQSASCGPLQPGVASALARSFSSAAAPAGQPEQLVQQLAAEAAAGQTSIFKVSITIGPQGPSPERASELASLGRALAAFDDVDLEVGFMGQGWNDPACRATVHALLQPVAPRLFALGVSGRSEADAVLNALQLQPLPRLARLGFCIYPGHTPGAVMAVAGLDAPRLATVSLHASVAGSRTAVVAAVTALAVGRPQPVGPDGRPAGLTVAIGEAALSDEELGEVRAAVAAVRRPCWITLGRPSQ